MLKKDGVKLTDGDNQRFCVNVQTWTTEKKQKATKRLFSLVSKRWRLMNERARERSRDQSSSFGNINEGLRFLSLFGHLET